MVEDVPAGRELVVEDRDEALVLPLLLHAASAAVTQRASATGRGPGRLGGTGPIYRRPSRIVAAAADATGMGPRSAGAALAMLAALVAGPVVAAPVATAWPGDPDGSWGSCGTRVVSLVAADDEAAAAAVLQPNGALVVAGRAGTRALVGRLLPDGSPDPAFGTQGALRFGPGTQAALSAAALTPAGKVVVAGSRTSGGATDSLVARVRADGTLDTGFHDTGTLVTNFGGADSLAAVGVESSGAIVVGGRAGGGAGFVGRYTTSGGWDTSFAGNGRRTGLPFSVDALVLQPDGKIVIGGMTTGTPDFALMRLLPDGSTDSSFGGASGVRTDLGGRDGVTALAIQADGAIVAAGVGNGPADRGHTILRRYTAAGVLDPSFTATDTSFGRDDAPAAVVAQSDGRILLAVNSSVGDDNDLVLARFLAGGQPDPAFGIDGATLVDAGRRSRARALVLPADGRALVVGSARAAGRDEVGVFRFQADGATAPYPGQGFVADGYGGLHGFGVGCAAVPTGTTGGPYWRGWDIVRGVSVLPGSRGVVLDGYGGLHRFAFGGETTAGFTVKVSGYWSGWDIARGVASVPEGTGGFVVDGYGGLHPFSVGGAAMPKLPAGLPYWNGQDVARGVALLPDGGGGYVLDKFGGLHPFGGAPAPSAGAPYWPGQDRARGVALAPDGSGGWIVDAFGATFPFGLGGNPAPPATAGGPSWPGFPIGRGIATLP